MKNLNKLTMKNKFLMVLAILGIMTLTYCGSPKSDESSEEAATEAEAVEPEAEEAADEAEGTEEEGEGEVEADTTAAE
jgi:hypothetical protein